MKTLRSIGAALTAKESVAVDKQDVPLLVKMYFAIWPCFHWIVQLTAMAHGIFRGSFVGLWLGVFSREDLYAVSQEYYDSTPKDRKGLRDEYNYFSREYNRSGLFDFEKRILSEYFEGCRRLLLYGAGGGRDTLALKRLGYDVDGFDSHPGLVTVANELLREEGYDATVHRVPSDEGPSTETTYDGIIISYGTYILISGRKRRIRLLQQLRARVQAECPIFVSFPYEDITRRHKISAFIANMIRRVLHREPVEVGDWLVPYYCHRITRDELASELLESGFRMVHYNTTGYGHAVGIAI